MNRPGASFQFAAHFIRTVPKSDSQLPPVIDVEFGKTNAKMTREEFLHHLKIMMTALENHYHKKPIIYTTEEFHGNYLTGLKIENLWAREVLRLKPGDWAKDWNFWQYSGKGRVNGIGHPTDLNVYRRERPELRQM